MKKILITLICLFTLMGCINREVDISKKQVREGIVYVVGESKAFTGKLVGKYSNGQVKICEEYKNGLANGTETRYYKNGEILYTGNYVDGKKDGEWNYYSTSKKLAAKVTYDKGTLINKEQYLVDVDGIKDKVKNLFN